MKKLFGAMIVLASVAIFISSAEAINVTLADIQNGLAVVEGNKATRETAITWENNNVGTSNRGGSFSFSSVVVPEDCIGTLTIGTETINVPLTNCTPGDSGGGPAPVARTGQTATVAAGDDGALQKGVPWPNPRFTDNGNGTITDNLTGLIWLKNANCVGTTRDWQTALNDVVQLNTNGTMNSNNCGDTSNAGTHQTDWRLPNIRELSSLSDYGRFSPSLPSGHPFLNVASNNAYWSSTTRADTAALVWVVLFSHGYVIDNDNMGNLRPSIVIAVRGGS